MIINRKEDITKAVTLAFITNEPLSFTAYNIVRVILIAQQYLVHLHSACHLKARLFTFTEIATKC